MPTPMCRRAAFVWLTVCAVGVAETRPSAAPLVVIETTGEEVAGRLQSLDSSDGVELLESDSPRLASVDVLKVVFEGATQPAMSAAPLGKVALIDSSWFEYIGVAFEGEAIHFELRGGASITTPASSIVWWRVGDGDALDMATTDSASDVLVVKRREGGYAPVEGVVVELNSEGVRFALEADDGAKPVEAPWARIGGIRFFRKNETNSDVAPAVLRLVDGGRIAADKVRYADGRLSWREGEAPVEAVASLDLSGDRVIGVSGLKLLNSKWTPYFSTEGKGYSFDESLLGGPLALRYPDRRAPGVWPAVAVERQFVSGVALRSRGELRLELPGGVQRVRGVVGLDPDAALGGAAEVRVMADDKTLWSGAIDGETAPVTIDEPLASTKTLTLQVDYGDNLDAGDFVNFCELRVIR